MKTISLKKVSAVAVASLGFGLMSVIPAQATMASMTTTLAVTTTPNAASATPTAVGNAVTADLSITPNAITAAATTFEITFTLLNPNGTDVTSSASFSNSGKAAGITTSTFTGATSAVTIALGVTASSKIGTITFTPAMAGVYKVRYATTDQSAGDNLTAAQAIADIDNTPLIHVAGSGAVVAASGVGTTTIGAVTGGIATVRFGTDAHDASTVYNLISSGVGTIQTVGAGTLDVNARVGIAAAADFTQGAKITTDGDTTFNDVIATVASTVAGTQTLTWTRINSTTGIPTVVATQAITWGAAPVLSAALSTAFMVAGDAGTATADVAGGVQSINTAQTATANAAATIEVITRNSAGTSLLATQTITATVSGPGTLSISTTNNQASQGRALTGTAGMDLIQVFGDGTSGTSTITITQGTTVIATKTVTFFGAVATLTVKQNHKIASSAGGTLGVGTAAPTSADIANTPAVVITAKDALGNAVPGLTITALSSDATVMSSAITVAGVTATPGNYNAAVTSLANTSGKTATLTFRVMSGTTVVAASAPVTYTLGGSVATVALSLDKTTYSAGAPAIVTITLKDSSGNAAFDADHTTILSGALATTLSVVKALQFNATTNTTVSSLGGVSTVAFNAPGTASAAWVISGTTGAGPSVDSAKALSVTASVTDATAALVTMIDALNAKIVALNALIAKIMKKLGVK